MDAVEQSGGGVRAQLQQLSEPLKAQLKEIERQIEAVSSELEALRETKRDVEFVLKRLDPGSVEKRTYKKRERRTSASRTAEVLTFIENLNGELGEDFGYTAVFKAMKDVKMAIGKEMVRKAFIELHEQGLLRMTRTTSGGGKAYALVGHA
jgi:Rad3-related DNA helicase